MLKYNCQKCKLKVVAKKKSLLKSKCLSYSLCWKCYRKAYNRWKVSIYNGYKSELETYIKNPRVQYTKGKKKSYFYAKQFCERALATPKWVDIEEIANFYEKKPKNSEVDHIIPIKGQNVCGLHVPWNLQYLSKEDNRKKNNN